MEEIFTIIIAICASILFVCLAIFIIVLTIKGIKDKL